MKQFKHTKSQSGVTLIEMLVVIIIILVLIAAASGRIGNVFGKNKVADEVINLNTLIVNTKTLRSAGGYGASGTNLVTSLVATDGVPKAMPVIGGAIKNSWDGTVAITSTGAGFQVVSPTVPDNACIDIANKVSSGGAVTTKINGNAAVVGEIPVTTATTQCNSSTSNTLTFTVTN